MCNIVIVVRKGEQMRHLWTSPHLCDEGFHLKNIASGAVEMNESSFKVTRMLQILHEYIFS